MPRDPHIRRAFEVADDAMQGAIGYFIYGTACKQSAPTQAVLAALPPHIQITNDWGRNYIPGDLCQTMEDCFEPYHARVSLIAIIGAFEGALLTFARRIAAADKTFIPPKGKYKKHLEWAFSLVQQSIYGDLQMRARIPDLCLDVDHARRIRNLWMHNNGLFDFGYATDGISVQGRQPIIEPLYIAQVQKKRRKSVPIVLSRDGFGQLSRSHIELLHHLHDTIQKHYFGQKQSYHYGRMKKGIEWHRGMPGVPLKLAAPL
jgi:hypothetical protein